MKRDYVDIAIDLYGEAGKAAHIIERQWKTLLQNESMKRGEENRINLLIYELEQRAYLTELPEDQKTYSINETRKAIDNCEYPEEYSQAMRDKNTRIKAAKEAIESHPLYNELALLIEEHNRAGGWNDEVTVTNLTLSDALNYSGEPYKANYEYGRNGKLTKHNGKIRNLQKQIGHELRLSPIIGMTSSYRSKDRKIITGYYLETYESTWRMAA